MKFGGLSEAELEKISKILTDEGVPYTVEQDQEIMNYNSKSMSNDLRHYSPPNISTHILAIELKDDVFANLSDKGREKLLEFGITDQVPSQEDFQPFTANTVQNDLVDGPKRMVAMNFKHQLIAGLVLLLVYLLFKYKS